MRIASSSFSDAQLARMGALNDSIARDQSRISGGQSRLAPSDDPAGAARSASLARASADGAQSLANLGTATARLQAADTALGSFGTALTRARELALQLSNGATGATGAAPILTELQNLRAQMVTLGNAQDPGGAYLFGGARASAPPFASDPVTGATVYTGLGDAPGADAGAAGAIPAGPSATAAFGAIPGAGGRTVFGVIDDLIAAAGATAAPAGTPPPATPAPTLGDALTGLGAAIAQVGNARAGLGALENRASDAQARLTSDATATASAKSALDDTDYASAITDLERASTILAATQKTFAQVNALSLFSELH